MGAPWWTPQELFGEGMTQVLSTDVGKGLAAGRPVLPQQEAQPGLLGKVEAPGLQAVGRGLPPRGGRASRTRAVSPAGARLTQPGLLSAPGG